MRRTTRLGALVAMLLVEAASAAAQTTLSKSVLTTVRPKAFGTQDYTISVFSGMQFFGRDGYVDPNTLSLTFYTCFEPFCGAYHYYQSLELPAGAVIDYIGVNSATPVDAALGFTLHKRDANNVRTALTSFSLPGHAEFRTDYIGPLGIGIPENAGYTYVLDIEHPSIPQQSFFGYVEVWWRLTVSDPPATATFADVPNGHPFYQFVEALGASGITGGCGGGNFCPDAPLTRGQMAVFLSKALGLRWSQ